MQYIVNRVHTSTEYMAFSSRGHTVVLLAEYFKIIYLIACVAIAFIWRTYRSQVEGNKLNYYESHIPSIFIV